MNKIIHIILLTVLFVLLAIKNRKIVCLNTLFGFVIFICLITFCNFIRLNDESIFVKAIFNIIIYATFIKFLFKKDYLDSMYLSISYWISIELVDLLLQYFKIKNMILFPNYFLMLILIIIAYIPYLYLENTEKKIMVFILPMTLCLLMIQFLNDENLFDSTLMIVLVGLFISNLCYLYFFTFTIKNIQLREERKKLLTQLELAKNNYNNTFSFLHTLIHDTNKIQVAFEEEDYDLAKRKFMQMNKNVVKKFNSIYSGNIALSTAICNIDIKNIDIRHFVQCRLDEISEEDLTAFFMEVLNVLMDEKEKSIFISITKANANKIIKFKTNSSHDFETIKKVTKSFIKKYHLKVEIGDKSIAFLLLDAK